MDEGKKVCDTCKFAIDGYELCPVCWQGVAVSEGFRGVLNIFPNLYRKEGEEEEGEHGA